MGCGGVFFERKDFGRAPAAAKSAGMGWTVMEHGSSPAGYGSAGGQPERRALAKGANASCRGVALSAPRHPFAQPMAPWPKAENSGGLGAGPQGCGVVPVDALVPGRIMRAGGPGDSLCRRCLQLCRCGLRPCPRVLRRGGGCGRGWR